MSFDKRRMVMNVFTESQLSCSPLKELQNYKGKLFFCPPQK